MIMSQQAINEINKQNICCYGKSQCTTLGWWYVIAFKAAPLVDLTNASLELSIVKYHNTIFLSTGLIPIFSDNGYTICIHVIRADTGNDSTELIFNKWMLQSHTMQITLHFFRSLKLKYILVYGQM